MKLVVRALRPLALLVALLVGLPSTLLAQGVTTGSLTGVVTDQGGQAVAGASVIAIHLPSGSTYEATTRTDGRFLIPGMRVGGPYSVTVSLSGHGLSGVRAGSRVDDAMVNLGVATDLPITVKQIAVTETVMVTAQSTDGVQLDPHRRRHRALARRRWPRCPRFGGRISDITRLTPAGAAAARSAARTIA